MTKKYQLRYLPLFEQDLTAARDYISLKLQNPQAADRLVEETGKAILKRLLMTEAFQVYPSKRRRLHSYYRIGVKNYSIFYVVIDDVMEVRADRRSEVPLQQTEHSGSVITLSCAYLGPLRLGRPFLWGSF